jgi:hypothetical protein
MDAESTGILERLALSGLEKCLAKLSKVSTGTWQITDIKVSRGTLEDAVKQHDFKNPAATVYVNVKGRFPFTSMMLFDPKDIECISKCFLGYYFSGAQGLARAEEMMLTELGNIVLNSLINSVLNALKRSVIPPVPNCVNGDACRLVERLGAGMDLKQNFRIVTLTLAIQHDKRVSRSEVFGMIPEELEKELEWMHKSFGSSPA